MASAIVFALGLTALGQDSQELRTLPRAAGGAIENGAFAPDALAVTAGSVTYVKTYGNVISGTTHQKTVAPEDVKATSDGGYILLATTDCLTQACVSAQGGTNNLVSWLVKTDSSGNPQWQKEAGCFTSPPGDYSIGVSLAQTTDGGYVVGGGSIDCGAAPPCGGLFSLTCAIVEKLDSGGNLLWAQTYPIGPNGGGISSIKQTADGGYVAAGSSYAPGNAANGALVLKLDGSGNLQWQRVLGPAGSTYASFNAVQPTADGGCLAIGNYYTSASQGALAVKLDSSGNVEWQKGFNDFDGSGAASGSVSATSIVHTSDAGYLVAGYWASPTGGGCSPPGVCPAAGALLFKLDSSGNLQWQNAYSGGTYCYYNGYDEVCTQIGAYVYSAHQTRDGGYVLAGDGKLELRDSVPEVPWLAKVDSSGNLLWQHFYYQVASTGRPLSQYFASSALARDGGFVAVGSTDGEATGVGRLYVVKSDSTGLCGACNNVYAATPLSAVNPGLTAFPLSLPVGATATPSGGSPSKTRTTSVLAKKEC